MTDLPRLAANTPGLPCRNDPAPFFSTRATDRQYAAGLCGPCPIRLQCASYALDNDERAGVWGGIDLTARVLGCGTVGGFRKHRRRGEEPCAPCLHAHEASVTADRLRRLGVEHGLGGTTRGYWLHWRLGEEACRPCKTAQARKSADRRAQARARAERPRVASVTSGAADVPRGAPEGVYALAAAA
ncbi:WhiB family transcriptional regulator [Streptomyces phaeochromogenes]|uniref:WhiB family transcriptional regulator n=1 Tax=Streptomyces phaeochromogenes TaxID=1923 RepID=UPI002DD7F777|nr:WhiB family transcriptional regulator [Streptomyces phaeochromogenes]WRZ32230.1 WhiB family transcriptional regulator [Streptomyces phaeochromogenes]